MTLESKVEAPPPNPIPQRDAITQARFWRSQVTFTAALSEKLSFHWWQIGQYSSVKNLAKSQKAATVQFAYSSRDKF